MVHIHGHGVDLFDHCGAESSGHLELIGFIGAIGGGHRASFADDADHGIEAFASASGRGVCRSTG